MSTSEPAADAATVHRAAEETPTVIVRDEAKPSHLQLTPGTVIGGRYRVVSLIGRGGMGPVYRADDLKIGHTRDSLGWPVGGPCEHYANTTRLTSL